MPLQRLSWYGGPLDHKHARWWVLVIWPPGETSPLMRANFGGALTMMVSEHGEGSVVIEQDRNGAHILLVNPEIPLAVTLAGLIDHTLETAGIIDIDLYEFFVDEAASKLWADMPVPARVAACRDSTAGMENVIKTEFDQLHPDLTEFLREQVRDRLPD